MSTLPHELCPEAKSIDSLGLGVPGLSMLLLNVQLSYRKEYFNGIVETCAFEETTTNNFCR